VLRPIEDLFMERRNIKQMTLEELEAFFLSLGAKSYRARQIWSWIYQKRVSDFASMTDLSKELRARLEDLAFIGSLTIHSLTTSRKDGAVKFLFRTEDGFEIESVVIPEAGRTTVCISTQVGCPLRCRFCATGEMGLQRDLAGWEIVEQVLAAENHLAPGAEGGGPTRISNVVLMGMGEPLLNYEQTLRAVRVINHEQALGIGARRITISTAGIVPGIEMLAEEGLQVKLAISLNAATDELRSWLMPINRRYPLSALMAAARDFAAATGKRVTFEYVLIDRVNDSRTDARHLVELVGDIPCKVNLIPFNPHPATAFRPPPPPRIEEFRQHLLPRCPAVTIRASRGRDIGAACGQLRTGPPAAVPGSREHPPPPPRRKGPARRPAPRSPHSPRKK
jgi:23S rRNA (adenine2503-C2)-methyltransferase